MSEQNLKALKTLVISMGVVLVIGFLVVGASIWMKMKGRAPGAIAAASREMPANCPGGTIDLKGRGRIVDTSIEGQIMRFAIARGDDLEMIHVDLCTAKEINTIKIITDSDQPQMPPVFPGQSQVPESEILPENDMSR
jgi:hypothetical protein